MSWFSERALGLDVSDGTLKAVLLARRGRRVRLLQAWQQPFHGDPDTDRGAREALIEFLRRVRPGNDVRIALSAPDRGHFSRTYVVPAMDAEQVDELVRYEILRELQLPESELLVRHHRRRGVVEEQVHAVALPRRPIEQMLQELAEQKRPWDMLVAPTFALASFVEHEQPSGRDRVLLGVGQLASHVALVRESGLWTRHLPLGLQHEEDIERLAERLASEIRAAVQNCLPPDARFHPEELILSEDGALSAPLTNALCAELKLPVRRLDQLARIDAGARWGEPSRAQLLSMGKAFGLALAGLELDRFRAPILLDDSRRQAARRGPLTRALLVAAAVVVLGAGEWIGARLDDMTSRLAPDQLEELHHLDASARQAQAQLAELKEEHDTLRGLALRRRATFSVRRALAVASEQLLTLRERGELHIQSLWLTPERPGRSGLLTLTLDAAPELDHSLAAVLRESYASLAAHLELRGPTLAPEGSSSRWVLELQLP
ncbi:MAG: hypothetical protein DHS20C15_21870 [Planctomycetota bacterium]|nr:MAG: hypothetical protein DHS20C15_21870 [Planctomycetota bacterium]